MQALRNLATSRITATSRLSQVAQSFSARKMSTSTDTSSYRMNHTMLRIKDPKASLHFYQEILGMDLVDTHKADSFTLYFLGYKHQADSKRADREGLIELTHNHGSESDPNFPGYKSGNEDGAFNESSDCLTPRRAQGLWSHRDQRRQHRGSLQALRGARQTRACLIWQDMGVQFQKRLTDGKMKNIAFGE